MDIKPNIRYSTKIDKHDLNVMNLEPQIDYRKVFSDCNVDLSKYKKEIVVEENSDKCFCIVCKFTKVTD